MGQSYVGAGCGFWNRELSEGEPQTLSGKWRYVSMPEELDAPDSSAVVFGIFSFRAGLGSCRNP